MSLLASVGVLDFDRRSTVFLGAKITSSSSLSSMVTGMVALTFRDTGGTIPEVLMLLVGVARIDLRDGLSVCATATGTGTCDGRGVGVAPRAAPPIV